ncbi:MAG: hypothetical protein WD068_01230 [Candidatus Babeliales bacterium]
MVGDSHIYPIAILILFGIYYVLSTLAAVFFLKLTSHARTIHSFAASFFANILSAIVAATIVIFSFDSFTLSATMIFALSNFLLQLFLMKERYDMDMRYSVIPLVMGNSLAYMIIFPLVMRLLQL